MELFPYLSALLIEEVERRPDKVVLRTRVRAATAACQCGRISARVHGRYVRKLRDVAVGGLGVVIELCIRRFRCENPACPAVTFAEQIVGLTTPHSRQTPQLSGVLTQIGLALAGRAGVRLASEVGITVGKCTLLRLVRALPEPEVGQVEVLGVDDFAFRKGRHYGTVLIDMATHRPLHIYDGRKGEDLAGWLRDHPEAATQKVHVSGRRKPSRSLTATTCGPISARLSRRRLGRCGEWNSPGPPVVVGG
ncbi:transposase family protein [Streptomyces griseobrunneus]